MQSNLLKLGLYEFIPVRTQSNLLKLGLYELIPVKLSYQDAVKLVKTLVCMN